MEVKIVLAYDFPKEVNELFAEYTTTLIAADPLFKEYLDLQGYDNELNHLNTKYGLPSGRLYLAYCDAQPVGCIGLKRINDDNCEMKRLYVRPKYRKQHIGELLVEQIVNDAIEIGYKHMLLDTLPFLQSAIHMYKKIGFYEINSYNNSPMKTSIYMRLDLNSYLCGNQK